MLCWIFIVVAHWNKSMDRHIAPLGHILIQSKPVFALSPSYCVLNREATNTNFIVFGLTRYGIKPTIYRTLCEHANHRSGCAILKVYTKLFIREKCLTWWYYIVTPAIISLKIPWCNEQCLIPVSIDWLIGV